jgi:hypothetical protein
VLPPPLFLRPRRHVTQNDHNTVPESSQSAALCSTLSGFRSDYPSCSSLSGDITTTNYSYLRLYYNVILVVQPAIDTLGDDAAYVGCCFGLYEMSMEVDQEHMTPRFSGLTAVQMGDSLNFVAVPAEGRRGVASSFAYSDGQPVVSKFDHECSGVIRESLRRSR